MDRSSRPGRPLGVTLAILASALLFGILPLTQLSIPLIIQARMAQIDLGDGQAPVFAGGNFEGVSDVQSLIQFLLAVIFIGVCISAWIGRPPRIRIIMATGVIVLTVLQFLFVIVPRVATQPDFQQGITSGDGLLRTAAITQFAISMLVALYVVWYLNRAPARAFFRGYYLADEQSPAKTT
jgi:hypothetical protein